MDRQQAVDDRILKKLMIVAFCNRNPPTFRSAFMLGKNDVFLDIFQVFGY
jgi:hypothetical protein